MSETSLRSRTLYIVTAALLLIAVIVDSAIWAVACHRLDGGAREAAASMGWTLQASAMRWGGWPAAAEITMTDAVLRSGPDIIPPLAWTAPQATLRLAAWKPTVLTVAVAGGQTLSVGAGPSVPFTAQTLVATIDLTEHDPVRLAATALDVTAPDGPVKVASADLLLLPDGVSVDLSGLILPGRTGQPITPPLDALGFTGRVTPPIQPQPTASDTARLWRSNGGKLELDPVALRWGPLDVTGRATLTLDQALQPVIAGQITASGLASVIEELAQTGAMTRSSATAAEAMLVILSAPSGGGPVTLPLALRDGIVSVARIPLLRLAPLPWD